MEINRHIEGIYLYPDATVAEIKTFLLEARKLRILGVTVSPFFVRAAKPLLKGSAVLSFAAIDFPLGQATPRSKAFAAREAVVEGAMGIEAMANMSMIKAHDFDFIKRETSIIRTLIGEHVPLRIAIESSLLTSYEIVGAAQAAATGGANGIFVGTPFGKKPSTEKEVDFVRRAVGKNLFVKASAGLRDLSYAKDLIKAGADSVTLGDPKILLLE